MRKVLVGLGVVASLYAANVTVSKNVTNYSDLNFTGSVSGSQSSDADEDKAHNNKNCYNAFSINYKTYTSNYKADTSNAKTYTSYIPSIITQIQNKKFYLYITNTCENTGNLKITLINKNTGKDINDYKINTIVSKQPVIEVNVKNSFKDLLVHFSYDRINVTGNGSCTWQLTKWVCSGNTKTTITSHEENSTDDFAVRPKQFNISADSTAFVGKPIKVNLNATGEDGNISTNYNADDMDLNTEVIDAITGTVNTNVDLSYFYNIKNGKIDRYRFFFTKPTKNDVKIQISEKLGKEWAIVDADDTDGTHRLISKGESNSITVNETSKNWAGVGTGEKENSPTNKTIQSDIRDNVNRNLKFNKMSW